MTEPLLRPSYTIVSVALVLVASMLLGALRFRGPEPKNFDAPADQASAERMRRTLEELLGDPPQPHVTGDDSGEQFLERLERKIRSFGVSTRRIEIPFDPKRQQYHPKGRIDLLPPDVVLKNLWVTIEGTQSDAPPILVATHHDSCRFGPGAGDAGSAVVALVEHIRFLSQHPPTRTTQYFFTDGEEFGLLGAYAIAAQQELPFPEPVFVLNFDARGTTGGVPMFETHRGNFAWVNLLIPNLAPPKITSSLAVTVYRALPNATDFNAWHGSLDLPGFNYATIGGAHRYHQIDDTPENLSDRTLQHMGDQLFAMHRAVDSIPQEVIDETHGSLVGESESNAVFFDLFGFTVISFRESSQAIFSVLSTAILCVLMMVGRKRRARVAMRSLATMTCLAVTVGLVVGVAVNVLMATTPYRDLRYTPYDYPVGVFTVVAAFLTGCMSLERLMKKRVFGRADCDWIWLGASAAGLFLAFFLPGGAYLLVVPSVVYCFLRLVDRQNRFASWGGWITITVLSGPMMILLVQALGPWKQHLYAVVASLLSLLAMSVYAAVLNSQQEESAGGGSCG